MLEHLSQIFQDQEIYKHESVQSLWSGYGEISRYHSPRLKKNFIVKHISPPANIEHPRGWHSQLSHQRKLQSYQIERVFYQQYSGACDKHCRVPRLFGEHQDKLSSLMVLEDLDQAGFSQRRSDASLSEAKLAISWLAYFHACFLNIQAQDLWPVGTYWHLATRQDEYEVMPNNELKCSAKAIDKILNNGTYQTLVHGDAKLANFCFHENASQIASLDFQYVGAGVGVKDLAYLLGSCFDDKSLKAHANTLLDYYFSELHKGVAHYQKDCDFDALEAEWRNLYAYAWADFYRFLQGWSPGHFKINGYMQRQTEIALAKLAQAPAG